jgi:OmpA-OmpF porin, OOP family
LVIFAETMFIINKQAHMLKIILSSLIIGFISISAWSQTALPPNPKPGMCYIRCMEEDTWREKNVQITKVPGHVKLEVIPAEYKMVEEQVMIKPAYKKLEIIPAVFKKVTETITVEDGYNKLSLVPVKFTNATEEVVVQPAYARFETRSSIENCKSKNPLDCEVLCYVEYPEHVMPFSVKKIDAVATYNKTPVNSKQVVITKDELVSPATVKEIEIPAVYKTVKKRVLVKDETVREINVEPQYENQVTRLLEKAGGVTVWEEISCDLTNYNVLPIFYALNSAALSTKAKSIIDEKILRLMTEKKRIRVEISSHTDSRDSDKYNLDLSQRRAQSVVDYLVSKGISKSRLIATGYGETRLKEPCPNGSNCTEAQHAKNRRTEFRVLTNTN